MKKLLILVTIFIFNQLTGAQPKLVNNPYYEVDKSEYFAIYDYTFQEDSLSSDTKRSTTMFLLIGSKMSKFQHSANYELDSLWLNSTLTGAAKSLFIADQLAGNITPTAFAGFYIIKHKENNIIDLHENVAGRYYWVRDDVNFNWKITQKNDTLIAGFKAKEANCNFRGRKYRAWFTTDLPINDGPYKFRGLPGLIIKLEDTKKQHSYELVSLEKVNYNKPIYMKNKNYISVTPKEYLKIKKAATIEQAEIAVGRAINLSQERAAEIEARVRRINNWMERF